MDCDVIIVGGGLVGAGLAVALRDSGLRLAVVEPRPPVSCPDTGGWDSRIYAISPGSAAFLDECGVWPQLDTTRMCRVEEMRVFGDDTQSHIEFSAYHSGLRELAFIVENGALLRAAWHALQELPDVEIIESTVCASLTFALDAARLELADGRVLNARLIVGADGADSWVRAQAGVNVEMRGYDQTAVVANFAIAAEHRGAALQWFQRDGVLALLPLPGARVSMVWSTTDAHAARLLQLAPEALAAEVGAASHDYLGPLALLTPAAGFPLRLQRVAQLVLPRLALAGDAAHSVHPLAGQGVNLGFRDARELAHVLLQRGAQADCGDYRLLRRYERARREDVAVTQFVTDTLQRLFNNDNAWLAKLRNLGLSLAGRQSALKNLLVQHAVG